MFCQYPTREIAAAAFYSYLNAVDIQDWQDIPVCGICRIRRIGRIFQFAGSDRAFEWEACVGRGRPERI